MNLMLTRRLMFFTSWAASFTVGVLLLGMTVLCNFASVTIDRLLGGKPLPVLTQFFLDIHGKPGALILGIALGLVATHAFVTHVVVSRAADPIVGIWIWLCVMAGTAFAMTLYVVLGVLSLLLPMISFTTGMVQPTPEREAAERMALLVFMVVSVGSIAYATILGVIMWRKRPKWDARHEDSGK